MSRVRNETIRRYLHFVNNKNQDSNPYFKVPPFLNILRENFLKIEEETQFSIDEMMVPYKGSFADNKRQYIKLKFKKGGIRSIYTRCCVWNSLRFFVL